MTPTLEQRALNAWRGWAVYRQHGVCATCGCHGYVGRARPRGRWLCVGCHDQGER